MLVITSEVRTLVHRQIQDLLVEANGAATPISGHEQMNDLGLTSLMLARLIIQLEADIGVDPFAEDVVLSDVRTVSDMVTVYERAVEIMSADGR